MFLRSLKMKRHRYKIFPPLPSKGRVSLRGWWAEREQRRRRERLDSSTNTAPPVLWLKGSDIVGSPGDSIAFWADASSYSNNAAQDTVSMQPTLQSVTFAGKTFKVARFDTVDDGMITQAIINDPTPYSIFVIWRPADLWTTSAIISSGDEDWLMGTDGGRMLCYFTNWSGATVPDAINTDDFYLFEVRITPGEDPTGIYINGVQTYVFPGGGSDAPNQVMLGSSGSNPYPGGCDAAEIMIYDRQLPDDEAADVRAYFQAKYNYLKL